MLKIKGVIIAAIPAKIKILEIAKPLFHIVF
jgi:hypothetical protein